MCACVFALSAGLSVLLRTQRQPNRSHAQCSAIGTMAHMVEYFARMYTDRTRTRAHVHEMFGMSVKNARELCSFSKRASVCALCRSHFSRCAVGVSVLVLPLTPNRATTRGPRFCQTRCGVNDEDIKIIRYDRLHEERGNSVLRSETDIRLRGIHVSTGSSDGESGEDSAQTDFTFGFVNCCQLGIELTTSFSIRTSVKRTIIDFAGFVCSLSARLFCHSFNRRTHTRFPRSHAAHGEHKHDVRRHFRVNFFVTRTQAPYEMQCTKTIAPRTQNKQSGQSSVERNHRESERGKDRLESSRTNVAFLAVQLAAADTLIKVHEPFDYSIR